MNIIPLSVKKRCLEMKAQPLEKYTIDISCTNSIIRRATMRLGEVF